MPNLTKDNNGNFVFNNAPISFTDLKNTITLSTSDTFVDGNIVLNTKVTKAVLNKTSGDTDHKIFNILIPNGNSNPVLLTFTTDTDGNTVVTGPNVT